MTSAVDVSLTIDDGEAARLTAGLHHDPHAVLGGSLTVDSAGRPCVLIRAWRPEAVAMAVLIGDERAEMERIHPAGLFATALPGDGVPDYRLEVSHRDGVVVIVEDPYRFWPTVGELDLHLFGEGRHEGCGGTWGPTRGCTKQSRAPRSRCGPPTPRRCAWWATSTAGTVVCTRCECSAVPACGSCFCPKHGAARGTSSKCSASTVI